MSNVANMSEEAKTLIEIIRRHEQGMPSEDIEGEQPLVDGYLDIEMIAREFAEWVRRQ